MEYSILDFSNVVHIRNQIAFLDMKTLISLYKDKDNYINFLETFVIMTNIDSGFLLFSEQFLDRVETIVQLNRFSFDNSEIHQTINDIIGYINQIKSQPESYKSSVRQHYACFQEEIRGVNFSNNAALVRSLGYDAYVIDALRDHDMSNIGEDLLFLASVNSFFELIPELFDDSKIRELTEEKIQEIKNTSKFYQRDIKRFTKNTENNFQKLLKGE